MINTTIILTRSNNNETTDVYRRFITSIKKQKGKSQESTKCKFQLAQGYSSAKPKSGSHRTTPPSTLGRLIQPNSCVGVSEVLNSENPQLH